jgi:peptidoglycan biosynthesis protein MviN/MurJ (putative lipid II flippase)
METLRILAVANAAVIIVAVLATAFQATGHASTVGRTLLAVTVVEAVALRLVVPVQGSRGAALVFLAAAVVAALALAVQYRARLPEGVPAAAWRWLARYALASGLGLAAALAVSVLTESVLAALAAAGAAYAAAVLAFGLVSPAGLLGMKQGDEPRESSGSAPRGLSVTEKQA